MSQFSNFMEEDVLDRYLGNSPNLTIPTDFLYVGLSTATITDATTGSTVLEPADGYSRVAVPQSKVTGWSNAVQVIGAGEVENINPIVFPTATGNWATVTDFFIATTATLGEILAYGVLDDPKTITSGDTAEFASGELKVRLD